MKKITTLFSLFLFTAPLFAHEITGKVIKVIDGDTITVLTSDYQSHKIRLSGIDAPEKGQPFGKKSKQMLSRLIAGKYVTATCTIKDKYYRDVCTIFKDNTDINATMIKNGGAWVYRYYYKGSEYYAYENQAKANYKGLWRTSEAQAIPPWQWREMRKHRNPPVKLSRNKICHQKGTKYYRRVKRFTAFDNLNDCLRFGRLPRG